MHWMAVALMPFTMELRARHAETREFRDVEDAKLQLLISDASHRQS